MLVPGLLFLSDGTRVPRTKHRSEEIAFIPGGRLIALGDVVSD